MLSLEAVATDHAKDLGEHATGRLEDLGARIAEREARASPGADDGDPLSDFAAALPAGDNDDEGDFETAPLGPPLGATVLLRNLKAKRYNNLFGLDLGETVSGSMLWFAVGNQRSGSRQTMSSIRRDAQVAEAR